MIQSIPGRNDLCPCGSGKKYKKCCLAKDEDAQRAASQNIEVGINNFEPLPEDKPNISARDTRFQEFEDADYENKIRIFTETLDEPELMNGDMAFEMLQELFHLSIVQGERSRMNVLLQNLNKQLPEIFESEKLFFLRWQIINALAEARYEDAGMLFRELALLAGKDIDIFNRVEEMEAYHCQLPAIVDSMRIAWPEVDTADNIVGWGIDEFCIRAMEYEVLNYVEQTSEPTLSDELLKQLSFYGETEPELIAENLAFLAGRNVPQWSMDDFTLSPSQEDMDEDDEEDDVDKKEMQSSGDRNLYNLTLQFLRYLKDIEGMPYAKGELGRRELYQFILRRFNGKLEYRESMLESAIRDAPRKKNRRSSPKRKYRKYKHLLVPDRERLDHFLSDLLDIMNQLYHRAAAFFEIIPAWLRFLELQGLIDAGMSRECLADLTEIKDVLSEVLAECDSDPSPHQSIIHLRWEAS